MTKMDKFYAIFGGIGIAVVMGMLLYLLISWGLTFII